MKSYPGLLDRKSTSTFGLVVFLMLFAYPSIASADSRRDIYGGVIAGHVDAEATGLMHSKKVGGRWIFYTALGNPFWYIAFDNARLGNDLGVDINGNGNGYYVAQKYAIGQGPSDGFTARMGTTARWAYYVRQQAAAWGFTAPGVYSYGPVVTNWTTWADPAMGSMPSNKMPFVITHNNSDSAMTAGAKNIYASVWTTVGSSPYFADPYDPKFAASVSAVAQSLSSHPTDPWVMYVFTGQVDQLRGINASHPHLGFVVAATNPVVSSDSHPYRGGGTVTYTDTKNYAKYALHDYLQSVYATPAALNAAWGTHYTTFDSAGGWGTGTGFLDENGRGLCSTWYKAGPSYPCSNRAMQTDLDNFATQLVRRYSKTLHDSYRAVTSYSLMSVDLSNPWSYSVKGFVKSGGASLFDLYMVAPQSKPTDTWQDAVYSAVKQPQILKAQERANNQSPQALVGTVTNIADAGTGTDCGVANQGVYVSSSDSNFWWWGGAVNGSSFIMPWANLMELKFSTIPYYKAGTTRYSYYVRKFVDAHTMLVCPGNYGGTGNKADFLRMVSLGTTFKRIDDVEWDTTPDTQDARGDKYAAVANDAWTRTSSTTGDQYFTGLEWWAWWDNNWVHSNYNEVENWGLVTPYGNAYDGLQDVANTTTDQYGFPAGGEAASYGNFVGKLATANQNIYTGLTTVH